MGRMSGIESKRRRNSVQKRRLKVGLIAGSVLLLSAFVFIVIRLLGLGSDKPSGYIVSNADILVESENVMPEYGAPVDVDTCSISAQMTTVKTKSDSTTEIPDNDKVVPGVVTPKSASVTKGGSVTLKATPKGGFAFLHWVKSDDLSSVVSDNSILTLTNVNNNITYTAVFYPTAVHVKYKNVVREYDSSGGVISETEGGGHITGAQEYFSYDADGDSGTLEFTAVPDDGYALASTISKDSFEITNNTTKSTTGHQPSDGKYITNFNVSSTEISMTVKAIYIRKSPNQSGVATLALQSSGLGYVIAGNHTGDDEHPVTAAPNGTSYATTKVNSTETTGSNTTSYFVFTVVLKSDDGHSYIREIYNADTGEALDNDNGKASTDPQSGVLWDHTGTVVGDAILYLVKIDSSKFNGGNFIVRVNQRDAWHMGAIITVAKPSEGGITAGDMTAINYQTTINTTVSATPHDGYMFDHWEYYDEEGKLVVNKKQQFQVAMSGFHILTAYFTEDTYDVDAVCDPEAGGMVGGTGKYKAHSDATLTAVEQPGYHFEKWTWKNEAGDTFEEKNPKVTIKDITENYKLTAHFSKANPVITLSVTPLAASKNNTVYNYAKISDGTVDYVTPGPPDASAGTVTASVTNGSSVTLQAFPNTDENYIFAYFVDQDGNTSPNNPYTIGNLKEDATYIAVFTRKQDKYHLKAIPDPEGAKIDAGTFAFTVTDPADTTNTSIFVDEGYADPHYNATVTALEKAGYKFRKWTWKTADGFDHESDKNPLNLSDIMEDYTLTGHFYKEKPKVKVTVSPTDEKDGVFNYAVITDTAGKSVTTPSSGSAEMETTGEESVTLQAFANDKQDYMFSYWVDKDGNTITANPYVIGKVTEDEEYTAIFTKKQDKYEIKLIADPDEGGTLTGAGTYSYHESGVKISAKANDGYKFDKWTWTTVDGTVHESNESSMNIENIQEDLVFTAHFIKTEPTVTVTVSPVDEVGGKYNYATITDTDGKSVTTTDSGTATLTTTGADSVTLQAYANEDEGYVFSYWVDKDGNTNPANPYVIGRIKEDEKYNAIFTKKQDKYQVRLISDPDDGGTLTGEGTYDIHSDVTVSAKANDGYTFDKWTWKEIDGTEHESTKAELVIRDIREDHVLTAHFLKGSPRITVNVSPLGDKEGSFNYADITDTDGHSQSTGSSGTASLKVSGGAAVTLTAVANKDAHYKFAYWVDDDGNVSASNPYVIGKASKDMTFTAVFTSDGKDNSGITVLASPPSGGKVSAKKNGKGGFNIKAKANRGYEFKYWKCVDTKKTVTKEKSFTISKEEAAKCYTYIAYFENDKDEKITSDIIDEYFPNIRRLFAQPNYKYTRESWISTISGLIAGLRGETKPASGTPATYSAYSGIKETMDEKAQNAQQPVITAVGQLVTTDNEVIPITKLDDHGDADERAARITTDKFGDHYTCDVMCVAKVSAPDGFDDGVRTYLWYNTGATADDNMFIIYELGGKEQIVTPVSDSQGVLTFTLDRLGEVNRFVLVRVVIK